MSKVKTLIQWFRDDGVLEELTDVERVSVSVGENKKLNGADILLKNPVEKRGSDGRAYTRYVNDQTGIVKFTEGDSIKIYAASMKGDRELDTGLDSSDLLMSAEVQEVNVKTGEKHTKITLRCVDKSFVMFNVLWSNNYLSTSAINTAPLIVQNIVRWASNNGIGSRDGFDDNGEFVLGGPHQVDARLESTASDAFIQDTRIDDSAFPSISIGRSFKPVYEWLDELSSSEYTNDFNGGEDENAPPQDRTMKYYVDEQNRFHWFYPKDVANTTLSTAITASESVSTITVADADSFDSAGQIQIGAELFNYTGASGTTFTGVTRSADNTSAEAHSVDDIVTSGVVIEEGSTSSGNIVLETDFTKATFDVVNAVIFNAGDDMNGSGMLGLFYDKTTDSPKLKMVYKAWTKIGRNLKKTELDTGDGLVTITHVDGDEYDYPANYNDYAGGVLPHWNPTDTSITTDSEFNDAFRTEARRIGESKARELTQQRGSPRYKGKITLQFRRFNVGRLVSFTSGLSGLRDVSMRVKTVQYTLGKSSNHVTISVEEDEKKEGT